MAKGRVLVVDDDQAILDLCVRTLKIGRYETMTAGSVAEARVIMESQVVDVAVLDLQLPDGNGIQLLKDIKARRPDCQVLLLTGHGGLDTAMEAIRAGAFDYLTKPFDMIKLTVQVERCLELLRLRADVARLTRELEQSRNPTS